MPLEYTPRERIGMLLGHREADRVGIDDSVWSTTLERWYSEGLPKTPSPSEIFGYEILQLRPDTSLRLPTVVLEETDEHTIVRNSNGTTVKNWKHATSTPGWLDHLVKTRADWEEYKVRAQWDRSRVDWPAVRRAYEEGRRRNLFIVYAGAISWDATLPVVGAEAMLYAMVDDPDWIRDMYQTYADIYLAGAEEMMGAGIEFDGAWVYDDMAYRSGPFFSPRTYEELLFPHDKRVCAFFRSRRMPIILHSCGRVAPLIPRLIEAGYSCLQPLEAKAGMDVRELKKQFGSRLAFMGGIDTRAMADPDPRVIEEEIASKVSVAKQGGGYIYYSDHSVPDSVSLEQYRRVLELVQRYGRYG